MVKKTLFTALVLFGLVFSQMAEECFADAQSQFDMAEQYYDLKEYEKAKQAWRSLVFEF